MPEPRTPSAAGTSKPPRLLDVLRGLAMVIVLYGHALEVLFIQRPDGQRLVAALLQYKVLSVLAMPLFFAVSGAAAASIGERGWRKALKSSLFLVGLALLAHWLGILAMIARAAATGTGSLAEILVYGLESTLKGRDFSIIVVWFLVSLAVVRLIAYALFSRLPSHGIWLALALMAGASFAVPLLPHSYMVRTWLAGSIFFSIGILAAPWLARLPLWPALVAAPLALVLALANRGCAYDPFAFCPLPELVDETATWLHAGEVGFPPLFYCAAVLACLAAAGFGRALIAAAATQALARGLAWIGKRTLELLIINGFVIVFLQPPLKNLPLFEAGGLLYPTVLVAVIVLHRLALWLLARPLDALQKLAWRLADAGLAVFEAARRRLAPDALAPPARPSRSR